MEPFAAGPLSRERVLGMTWGWPGRRGAWTTEHARDSMLAMTGLGTTWVTLAYAAEQAAVSSTTIGWCDTSIVTDEEIRRASAQAHGLGLSVCLKPVVNVSDGTWRAHIGFFDVDVPGEATWDEWFDAYTEYVVHHAALAQEVGAELLCIGCEMVRADARETSWRSLIDQVRTVYTGPITYNADKYQEDRLNWWDAVDVISSSGYYPTGSWSTNLDRIEAVVARYGKPFVFMEAGCPSRAGSPDRPNDWTHVGDASESAQADYLDEMLTAIAGRTWVAGLMLWDWPADLYPAAEAPTNTDYCIYGKAGAAVVKKHFRALAPDDGPRRPPRRQ
jgi:hypothetical protein